nr:exogastrula-inducing polypeptide-like isoform X1 [Lytechinus pictus]
MKTYLAFMVAIIGVGMVVAEENLKERLVMALKSLVQDNEELSLEARDSQTRCMMDTKNCNEHGSCVSDRWGSYYCKCTWPYRYGGSDSSCHPPPETKPEDLEMQARDTESRCMTDTDECNGHGTCVQSTFGRRTGQFICRCDAGYKNNLNGGCNALTEREIEYLSNVARDMELEMLTRDTMSRCVSDTQNCDGNGKCTQSTFGRNSGQYICLCDAGFKNNAYGGCSPQTEREVEFLAMLSRDLQLELQARDTLRQCNADTNNCDGAGECKQSAFGRNLGQFICWCNTGYSNNLYGGCSPDELPENKEEDEVADDVSKRRMELMQQITDLLAEE